MDLKSGDKLGDARAGLRAWLARKSRALANERGASDLAEFVAEHMFDPAERVNVPRLMRSFINNCLGRSDRMAALYSPAFIDFIHAHDAELEELSESFTAFHPRVFFRIFAELFRVRVKIVTFLEDVKNMCYIGNPSYYPKMEILVIDDKLHMLHKVDRELLDNSLVSGAEHKVSNSTLASLCDDSRDRVESGCESTNENALDGVEDFPPSFAPSIFEDVAERVPFQGSTAPALIHSKFKDKVLSEEHEYKRGVIKFFSQAKEYGFIVSEGKEYFVHKDDIFKAGVDPFELLSRGLFHQRVVEFRVIQYKGKSKVNQKAIDLRIC